MVQILRLCGEGKADFCRGYGCIGVSRRSRSRGSPYTREPRRRGRLQYTRERLRTSYFVFSKNLIFTEFCCRALRGVKSVNGRSSDTVPTELDANVPFERGVAELKRYVQRLAQSASSKSATCVYGRRLRYSLGLNITRPPAKRQLCSLKFFGSFF